MRGGPRGCVLDADHPGSPGGPIAHSEQTPKPSFSRSLGAQTFTLVFESFAAFSAICAKDSGYRWLGGVLTRSRVARTAWPTTPALAMAALVCFSFSGVSTTTSEAGPLRRASSLPLKWLKLYAPIAAPSATAETCSTVAEGSARAMESAPESCRTADPAARRRASVETPPSTSPVRVPTPTRTSVSDLKPSTPGRRRIWSSEPEAPRACSESATLRAALSANGLGRSTGPFGPFALRAPTRLRRPSRRRRRQRTVKV